MQPVIVTNTEYTNTGGGVGKRSLLILSFIVLLSACKKDGDNGNNNNNTNNPTAKETLLMSKDWQWTKLVSNGYDVTDDVLAPCDKDNYLRFKLDKKIESWGGNLKCKTNEADMWYLNSNWSFLNNEKDMLFLDDTFNIVELSATKLTLSKGQASDKDEFYFQSK